MSRVTKIPPEIRAEAAAWLARLRADDKDSVDERAFRAWLAQDTSHAAAFEAVTEVWEAAGAVRPELPRPKSAPAILTRRRAVLAGVSALAVVGSLLALRQRANARTYETAVGEQKHVVLADGTQAFLDTDTCMLVSFDSKTRVIDFERGRCNFRVTDGDSRPFVVNASLRCIVAGRSDFDVQRDNADVAVVLLEGSATVSGARGLSRNPCLLKAGDRLVVAHDRAQIDRPNLARVLAWQTGEAVFENDALADAVREMNRYSAVKLEAHDSVVAQMRISGVYHVGDNVAFARSVAALLPVSLEVGANQIRLIGNPARAERHGEIR